MKILRLGALLLVVLLCNTCAVNPVSGRKDFMLLSESQEVAMGKESDPGIVQFFGLYENPELQRFIQEKGKQMAAVSHRKGLQYEFKIVDSPVVNAFAVPGGYVYFTRGIMAHFNNEAEFAGVLGHEIGHITARHSAKQYSNNMLAQIGLVAGMVLVPQLQQFGDIAQQGVGLLFLKFGRDAESQADKLGVEYSTKIDYDAREMADFFEVLDRLQKQSGASEVPDFLSTHPNPLGRQKNVAKEASEWQKKTNAAQLKVNRDSYLKMIDGLVYGEDPRQGFVENSVFYHPGLKFQFPVPREWTVQNTPQQVQLAPSDGRAIMLFTLAPGTSLESSASEVLKNYQLTAVESKKENLSGLPALVVVADQQQGEEQAKQSTLRALLYFIEYGGNIYTMIGASSLADFNAYFPTFTASMSNFSALSDPKKLNKQPAKVRIKTVAQNANLSEALNSLQVSAEKKEEVAILNGMKLTDKVVKGTLIKVIE